MARAIRPGEGLKAISRSSRAGEITKRTPARKKATRATIRYAALPAVAQSGQDDADKIWARTQPGPKTLRITKQSPSLQKVVARFLATNSNTGRPNAEGNSVEHQKRRWLDNYSSAVELRPSERRGSQRADGPYRKNLGVGTNPISITVDLPLDGFPIDLRGIEDASPIVVSAKQNNSLSRANASGMG